MSEVSTVNLEIDGHTLEFSTGERLKEGEFQPTGVGEKISAKFSDVFDPLQKLISGFNEKIEKLEKKPSNVEISIGVTISADAGLIFASSGAEGQMQVKLSWDLA